jgi:ribosomal protein L7Ae-like RNA K-turn-binding protein
VERSVADRVLRLIGLGARARNVVIGIEQVRKAAKKGKLELALVAPDASMNSRDKIVPLLRARRIKFVEGPTAAELGAAVGREQTAAVGVIDRQLARGISALADASRV